MNAAAWPEYRAAGIAFLQSAAPVLLRGLAAVAAVLAVGRAGLPAHGRDYRATETEIAIAAYRG